MLSIVIPIHNEEPAILPLYDRLTLVLERLKRPYEILFIDDASTDRSFDLLANLVETDAHLKVLRLRRNFGQTAALAAGFDEAQGEIIVSLDGDLQHAASRLQHLLPPGASSSEFTFERLIDSGFFFCGDPDTVYEGIKRFYDETGGFGTLLLIAGKDWGTREQRTRSMESFMTEVAPRLAAWNPDADVRASAG